MAASSSTKPIVSGLVRFRLELEGDDEVDLSVPCPARIRVERIVDEPHGITWLYDRLVAGREIHVLVVGERFAPCERLWREVER